MKTKLSVLAIALCLVVTVSAQNKYYSNNKKAASQFEKAMNVLYAGKFNQGILELEKVLKIDPNFIEVHLTLGDFYCDSKDTARAQWHYEQATLINESFYPIVWLRLGDIYKETGNYDKAENSFGKYLSYEKKDKKNIHIAKFNIQEMEFRRNAIANPVPFKPQNMGAAVNSKYQEYLPSLTADGQTLVFTRRVPTRESMPLGNEEDLYISSRIDGQWTQAMRMPSPLNSDGNEGAECVSQDGRLMFFTACDRKGGAGSCDLYVCVREGDKWSAPHNLGKPVNTDKWETQPSFSIDGRTLYFASNRPGGKGGNDIWKTVLQDNGRWSVPVNLGDSINTAGDEKCPFIHYDDQTLYFASNGHVGMGGFDIYYSRKINDSTWSRPVNIGYPINTSSDEASLIVSPSGSTAIFASDRKGGYGDLDLYQFELYKEAQPIAVTYMKGIVFDQKTNAKLSAQVKIIDVANGAEIASTTSDPVNGSFIISLPINKTYALNVSRSKYLFYSDNIELQNGTPDKPFLVNIALKPIEIGESIVLKNIFFETGSAELKKESLAELTKLMQFMLKNPDIRIEISGHTDNVGTDAKNQKLSENRANAVANYLYSNGIDKQRVRAVGYGKTRPIDTNDTEQGRANNRRTMFEIIK